MTRGFSSFHPFNLLLYYIGVLTGLMIIQHPIFLFIALFTILGVNWVLDKGVELKKWRSMILFLSLFVILFTPIFNQQGTTVLFTVFSRDIYLEAVIQGVLIALKLAGILTLFASFNVVMKADKLLYLFSKWFPKWSLILIMALRFIPLFRQRLSDITEVQTTKGVSMDEGNIRAKAQNGMQLIQILLSYSLEEAIQTADSMTARGYGLQKRTRYQHFIWKTRDSILLVYLIALIGIMIIGWQLKVTGFAYELSLQLENINYLYLCSWILLIGLPIGTEGKEVIKWKYSLWRI